MEAAIASVKPGIRSESLLKPSSGDDVDVLGCTSEVLINALLLCTRSDAFSRLQKLQPSKVLARVLEKWTFDTFETKEKSGSNSAVVNPEVVYAQLRYVCILMDSIGGVKGCSKSFGDFPTEMKAKFVFFYALSCLPSLDALSCIAGLTATGIHETGNQVVSSALGYLFSTSTPCSREVMVSWFIAACQFGGIQAHLISSKVPASPREWSDYSRQLGGNVKERIAAGGKRKELQERLISFCFSPTGYIGQSLSMKLISGYDIIVVAEYTRLTEEVLDDNSPSAAKAMEGLLFSRLAPLLVLRMLPRGVFGSTRAKILSYIDRQLQVDDSDSEAISEVKMGVTSEVLFHCLARSVVDPLEFKEVKMLATECLSKFPPPLVLPFVFAYVVAFLREATLQGEQCSSLVVEEDSVPDSCGLVTAKLMVYYLNRIFSEDEHAYKDCDISSKALVLLVQVLAIESDDALVTDLQRGCIDCIALILSRLAANDSGQEAKKVPTASASSLMNMLITWIFGIQNGEDCIITQDVDGIDSRVQRLFERMWSKLDTTSCHCKFVFAAAMSFSGEIIFSFLHKASDFFSIEDNGDLQLVRMCFETTAARLESTRSESIAMNGLKVVGALIGKLPGFMETLSSEDLQQLIDRYDITSVHTFLMRLTCILITNLQVFDHGARSASITSCN
ncbi:hypothetical protein GQ600_27717 [Phytophthora cactorum]|nr:hypothetical protein GQ600_27717 [Phytophthora cactorum]